MFDKDFNSILELIQEFNSQEKCIAHLEELFWQGTPISPFSPSAKVYRYKNGKYKCADTRKYFTVLTGTLYDNTKIGLQKWFIAIWMLTGHKKGISSIQMAKEIGVTQKTSWFMMMRIRNCFGIENDIDDKFDGIIESDETFVGGKNKNRHKDKKVALSQGRSFKDKTPVIGVLQRAKDENSKSRVKCVVGENTRRETIQPFIQKVVEKDSVLISDEWHGYKGLESNYDHHVVDHGKKQYVNFENPEINSNSIESFWGIMKRSYNGIYNWWSKKHMQKYVDEHVYRFNLRDMSNSQRFNYLLLNSNTRTTYKSLIHG